jgi:hypothetical protein
VGSVMPDASATAPLIPRHVCFRKGNRGGCHKESWAGNRGDMPPTNATWHFERRESLRSPQKSKRWQAMGHYDVALRLVTAWVRTSRGSSSKELGVG